MPKDIYNLGRSVGMSAWEIYVRQSLLLNPDIEPLSEREWLSDSIGMGTSLLLKIKSGTTKGIHDYKLPDNSTLCAPNTIVGSYFYGSGGQEDSTGWSKVVTDYGIGINNSAITNGVKTESQIPKQTFGDIPEDDQKKMLQYVKIRDAIFLQKGTWSDSGSNPSKTFLPDLTERPTLRIIFQSNITHDFYLLLTGFVTRAIVKGEVGYDLGPVYQASQAGLYHPENGDYLGPELFPWASKVVFTYPGILNWILMNNITSESPNIDINREEDAVTTTLKASKIQGGTGTRVNDPSTLSNKAQPITITSELGVDANHYVKATPSNVSTEKPYTLKGSKATPGKGVGIIQPTDDGGDHTISAVIQVAPGYEKYMKIEQEARNDNTTWATKITPAYPKASKGIAIDDASSAGIGFNISSIIESKGNASKYIKVEQNSSNDSTKTTTELTPSKIVPSIGVGITQPSSAGGDITIGAKMESEGCGAKYLKITQDSSDKDAGVTGTRLAPARITTGLGAAITQPSNPGENITISSITQNVTSNSAARKYIKITQEAHDSGCGCGQNDCGDGKDASNVTTKIENSLIIESDPRITVEQPTEDAGNIRIGMNLEIKSGKGIQVTTENNGTSITIDALVGVSKGIGTTCEGTGKPHMFSAVVSSAGSASKYIKVTQTNGSSSLTEVHTKLEPSKLIVETDGASSDYSEITDYDRSEWLIVEQPSSDGGDIVLVPTIVVPGVGLTSSFNKKTRTFTINNALLGGSWKTLDPDTDYEFEFLGNFYSAERASYEPSDGDVTGKAFKVATGAANKPSSDQYLQLQWQPSKDKNGNVTSASFRLRTTSNNTLFYAADFMDDSKFKFKHSNSEIKQTSLWAIAKFRFRSGGTKWSDMNKINDEDNFDFIDTSGTTSGIWNVHNQEGKNKGLCWNVNCQIARSGKWFILYASQIADGYNSQYKTLCTANEVTAAYTNYHLNLSNTFSVISKDI